MIGWASYPYEGFVVLITGAGSGIGRAIARAFLEQGATVAVAGRRRQPLEETVAGAPTERVSVFQADMSDADEVARTVEAVRLQHGKIDVVIANAGVSVPGAAQDLSDEAWEHMRSINIDGLIALTRETAPHLRESGGNLIAISSVAGFGGDWNQAGYNATKGAVNAFVQSAALDLGRDGVRVNAIAPAFTETALTTSRLQDPVFWNTLRERLALDRAAQPEDVARAALFLASPDADYLTGVILPVDGGTTASVGMPRPPYEITEY